jgi:hypothetical protein
MRSSASPSTPSGACSTRFRRARSPTQAARSGATRSRSYDLRKTALARSIDVPLAVQLNDLAVAPDGTLLVTDSGGGGVWRVDPQSAASSRSSRSARHPAPTASRSRRAATSPTWPRAAARCAWTFAAARSRRSRCRRARTAAAIDGLYWHDGTLIGVQNVTTPARVIRLRLARDGVTVTAVETLQSHHQAAFDEADHRRDRARRPLRPRPHPM